MNEYDIMSEQQSGAWSDPPRRSRLPRPSCGATLKDALAFVKEFHNAAQHCGYLLAPYGSTIIDGVGRDVDILAVPLRNSNPIELLAVFKSKGYMEIGPRHFGLMGTFSTGLQKEGQPFAIDLQIREESERDIRLRS